MAHGRERRNGIGVVEKSRGRARQPVVVVAVVVAAAARLTAGCVEEAVGVWRHCVRTAEGCRNRGILFIVTAAIGGVISSSKRGVL